MICGDFHWQFEGNFIEPVVQKKWAPLYWPVNLLIDNKEEVTGSELS